jgi:hypothetical protein
MLFSPNGEASPLSIIAAVLLGAVIFMLMSVISYALQRGKRDFSSTRQVLPSTWDVVVDRTVAGQAKQLASRLPMRPSQATSVSGWGAPQQGAPNGGPAAPGAGQPTPGQPTDQPTAPSADFKDLADGRPRYGVRVEQPAATQPEPAEGERDNASAPHEGAPAASVPNLGTEFRPQADQAAARPDATSASSAPSAQQGSTDGDSSGRGADADGESDADARHTSSGTDDTHDATDEQGDQDEQKREQS